MKESLSRALLTAAVILLIGLGSVNLRSSAEDVPSDTRLQSSPITIVGNDDLLLKKTTYNWNGTGSENDPVTIDNLEIDASGGDTCLSISDVSLHFEVRSCTFTGATDDQNWFTGKALYLNNCRNGTIKESYMNDNKLGIYIHSCSWLNIEKCWMDKNTQRGILLSSSSNITLMENTVVNAFTGVYLIRSSNVAMIDMNTWAVQVGISISESFDCFMVGGMVTGQDLSYGIAVGESDRTVLKDINIIGGETAVGINLDYADNTTVSNCFVKENDEPMTIQRSRDCSISGNLFYNNKAPLQLYYYSSPSECDGVRIWNNTFSKNNGATFNFASWNVQAADLGNVVKFFDSDTQRGNHWTDWTSPDLDDDGIVDEPYPVAGGTNFDPLPLLRSPMDLSGPPKDLEASAGQSGIRLSWKGAVKHYGLNIDMYRIYRSESGGDWEIRSTSETNTVFYTDGEVFPGLMYSYMVSAITEAGEGPLSDPVSIVFDTTPPEITITYPKTESVVNTTTLRLEWNIIERESDLTRIIVYVDDEEGKEYLPSEIVEIELDSEGYHTISVEAWNALDLRGEDDVRFTLDTVSPFVTFNQPELTHTNLDSLLVEWQMADSTSGVSTVFTRLDEGNWVDRGRVTELVVQLHTEGLHHFSVMVRDQGGNNAQVTKDILMDKSKPSLDILFPLQDSYLNTSTFELSFTSEDSLSGISRFMVQMDSNLPFEYKSNMPVSFNNISDGTHQISVSAYDRAGNIIIQRVSFTIDTSEPYVIQFLPAGEQVAVDEDIWLIFSELLDPDSIEVKIPGVDGELSVRDGQVTYIIDGELEYATTYRVEVGGSDTAGNRLRPHSWNFTTTDIGYIEGIVVDEFGAPMVGIKVNLAGLASDRTDGNGRFNISYHMGTYPLNITRYGYQEYNGTVTITAGRTTSLGTINLLTIPSKDSGSDTPMIIAITAVVLVSLLIAFMIGVFLIKRHHDKHYISEEDREHMLEILRHFDVSTKIDQVDAYETLGVSRTVSQKEIKKAYRNLAAKYHPDRAMHGEDFNEEEAHKKMHEINAAKTILLDSDKRDLQDRILRITGRY
ncbi:MAG: NosD domain-containing protein [Thermoplasmatota archaeon]